jgi:hypothetical protein
LGRWYPLPFVKGDREGFYLPPIDITAQMIYTLGHTGKKKREEERKRRGKWVEKRK